MNRTIAPGASPPMSQSTKSKFSVGTKIQKSSDGIPPDMLPHACFAGACFLAKTMFGSLLRIIATKGITLVNFWYPFLATIACVHQQRHPSSSNANATAGQLSQGEESSSDFGKGKDAKGYHYWFQYWTLYALAQTLDHLLLQVCLVLLQRQTSIALRNQLMAEVNFLFTVYLLVVPSAVSFCYKLAQPHILKGYHNVSEAVSNDTWTTVVSSKAEQLLELMVTVNILTRPWKERIILTLMESRTLIVPAALTLLPLTPTLFTRLGVVYTQFLLPVGKSTTPHLTKLKQLHSLQYWILHSFVSILFEVFRYFWWVPFYDHSMFLFWAYLSFDTTITKYYNILEVDLISLGFLPGDSNLKVGVHETQTVQLLTALAKKIPSADKAELEKLLQEGNQGSVDASNEKNENVNIQPHPAVITSRMVREQQPQDATAQLKALVRQLPIDDKDLDLDDEKTKQLLEMLIQELKKEEEKVITSMHDETSSPAIPNVRRVTRSGRQINHPPSTAFADDENDVLYESKRAPSEGEQVEESVTMKSARDLDIRPSSTRGSTASMNTFDSDSNADKFSIEQIEIRDDATPQHRAFAPEESPSSSLSTSTKTRVSTLDAVVVDIKSSKNNNTSSDKDVTPSPSRYAMSERRLKRERVRTPSSESVVSRLLNRMESNQKAKRKAKREKLKEYKKEKLKKRS